jgi:hypothetical protein
MERTVDSGLRVKARCSLQTVSMSDLRGPLLQFPGTKPAPLSGNRTGGQDRTAAGGERQAASCRFRTAGKLLSRPLPCPTFDASELAWSSPLQPRLNQESCVAAVR